MNIVPIVFLSLVLQCIAVVQAVRLIQVTGHKKAWILLSLGIATMAGRRFITLVELLSGSPQLHLEIPFEIIGVAGSAMMVAGVFLIGPIFQSLADAELEQRKLAGRLQEALDNVRVLREMLPMCSGCKKIRNDKGYWENVETYISKHTDTVFSHGMCPECIQKWYPEYSGNKTESSR